MDPPTRSRRASPVFGQANIASPKMLALRRHSRTRSVTSGLPRGTDIGRSACLRSANSGLYCGDPQGPLNRAIWVANFIGLLPRGPGRQDETSRTVDLDHSSDGPSWIDLIEIRFDARESRRDRCLNRLLQENLSNPNIDPANRTETSKTKSRPKAASQFKADDLRWPSMQAFISGHRSHERQRQRAGRGPCCSSSRGIET
jgi:hypothetical protein